MNIIGPLVDKTVLTSYIGARGQISTRHDDDEGYTHVIELVD